MPQTEMKEIERSDGCFACDWNNPAGLGIRFYTDGQGAYGEYIPTEVYQGYKGIVHGGILAALLDEVMAKALAAHGIDGVTAKLEVRFRSRFQLTADCCLEAGLSLGARLVLSLPVRFWQKTERP